MKLTWKKVILVCVLVLLGYLMYTRHQPRSPVKISKGKRKKSTVSTKSDSTPDSTSESLTVEDKLKICMYNLCDENEPYAYIDQYGFDTVACTNKPYSDQNVVNVKDEQDPNYPTCKDFYYKNKKDRCKQEIEKAMCGNISLKDMALSGDENECSKCFDDRKVVLDLEGGGCKEAVANGICGIKPVTIPTRPSSPGKGGVIHNLYQGDLLFNCLSKKQLKNLLDVRTLDGKDLVYLNNMPTCEQIHNDIDDPTVNGNYYAFIANDGKARVLPENTTEDLQSLNACRIAPYCRHDIKKEQWIKCVDNNYLGGSVLLDCKKGKCTNGKASYAGATDMDNWRIKYGKTQEPETCMSCEAGTKYMPGKTLPTGLIFDVSDDGSFPTFTDNGAVGKYDATKTKDQTSYLFNRCETLCPQVEDPCQLDTTQDEISKLKGDTRPGEGWTEFPNFPAKLDAKCPNNETCGTNLDLSVEYELEWDTECEAAKNHNKSMCSNERYFTTSNEGKVTQTIK